MSNHDSLSLSPEAKHELVIQMIKEYVGEGFTLHFCSTCYFKEIEIHGQGTHFREFCFCKDCGKEFCDYCIAGDEDVADLDEIQCSVCNLLHTDHK